MKRISLFVISAHVALLLWMVLWMPVKKVVKKSLQVRTVIEVATPTPASAPAPVIKKEIAAASQAPPKPKKAAKKPIKKAALQKPKGPLVPDALIRQLQESIAKIEEKGHKDISKKAKVAPKQIPKLQIDAGSGAEESIYASHLVQCLQNALELPEMGTVKLELTLKCDGTFVQMQILQSASNHNQKFLQSQLHSLKYPAFNGLLKQEKEHAFVITFCNH
ncbi:MAG: hypothetical protein K940chlam6_00307 [Chlamydiae bacterium]|nr:hypothetical protein [Chlamydiota bacterium]